MRAIKKYIRNGKKMKWKPKRIAETLHHLGFSDEEITKQDLYDMEVAGRWIEWKKMNIVIDANI